MGFRRRLYKLLRRLPRFLGLKKSESQNRESLDNEAALEDTTQDEDAAPELEPKLERSKTGRTSPEKKQLSGEANGEKPEDPSETTIAERKLLCESSAQSEKVSMNEVLAAKEIEEEEEDDEDDDEDDDGEDDEEEDEANEKRSREDVTSKTVEKAKVSNARKFSKKDLKTELKTEDRKKESTLSNSKEKCGKPLKTEGRKKKTTPVSSKEQFGQLRTPVSSKEKLVVEPPKINVSSTQVTSKRPSTPYPAKPKREPRRSAAKSSPEEPKIVKDSVLEKRATQVSLAKSAREASPKPEKIKQDGNTEVSTVDLNKYLLEIGGEDFHWDFYCAADDAPSETEDVTGPSSAEKVTEGVTDQQIKSVWKVDHSCELSAMKMKLPKDRPKYKRLRFVRTAQMYNCPSFAQQTHKRVLRNRHDAWRRFGPLAKIHEIGGWAFDISSSSHRIAHAYYRIEPGTKASSMPVLPPIMNESQLLKRPMVTSKRSSTGRKSERSHRGKKCDDHADPETSPTKRGGDSGRHE
ncbi:hypothetical protein L596_009110 [Steinernema carpocapsae]|uniref:Uncharacterized protein n=1 Tax=Steinernema carpocapsae TaxID=34508 RepID=A0A4U5PEL2_STECR|nr:hypothetical protein L596_009110 [Steinernema carpocapsae]